MVHNEEELTYVTEQGSYFESGLPEFDNPTILKKKKQNQEDEEDTE